MDELVIYVALALFGVALGSFAGATVWRLRARQLEADKAAKEPYDKAEYKNLKKLIGKKALKDRSQCLRCSYELKWYDLIPVVSWLTLKGKCRKCKRSIGKFELLIELGSAAFFMLSYAFWPFDIVTGLQVAHFILWLAAGLVMAILFAYDAKWYLLPDRLNLALAVVGVAIVTVVAVESTTPWVTVVSALSGVAILSGVYAALYFVSKGRWVGFGDVKLGVGLALIVIDWQLALLALFLANFIGCLVVIPLMLTGKLKTGSQVPFGPLLILGAVTAWFVGWPIISWYLSLIGV